jgi:hypothetical protein
MHIMTVSCNLNFFLAVMASSPEKAGDETTIPLTGGI